MSQAQTRNHEGQTAQMRESINNQIQAWASRANWADEVKADRLFKAIDRRPEDFISPNPSTCGSYREEASRIYSEIKEEYGLRTVSEAAQETDSAYADERKSAAASKLREEFEAIEAGEREELVDDIAEEYGDDFVRSVLADERVERRLAESHEPADDENETMSTETETPLGKEQSGKSLGDLLIAAGERLNNNDRSLVAGVKRLGAICKAIWTMPLYLLVIGIALAPIYLGLKCTVVTGKAVKWLARGIWWVVSGIPKAVVWLTEAIESWMATRVDA